MNIWFKGVLVFSLTNPFFVIPQLAHFAFNINLPFFALSYLLEPGTLGVLFLSFTQYISILLVRDFRGLKCLRFYLTLKYLFKNP